VRLRESFVTAAALRDLVFSELRWVCRQLGTSVDELEVQLFVFLCHLGEDLPEPLNNFCWVILFNKSYGLL